MPYTVRELIEELSKLPPTAPVVVEGAGEWRGACVDLVAVGLTQQAVDDSRLDKYREAESGRKHIRDVILLEGEDYDERKARLKE
jgi:hypothetical protein